MFSAIRAGGLTSKIIDSVYPNPTTWIFAVSGVWSGFPNPPTQAQMSDGIVNTEASGFGSSYLANSFIRADFGQMVFLSNAHLRTLVVPGWNEGCINNQFLEISSDGSAWTLITTLSGFTYDNTLRTFPVNAECRYCRVYGGAGLNYTAAGDFFFD